MIVSQTSLIGNVDAFTSFSFGTPSAPAPVNTGQTFTNNNPTNAPTFVNTNPRAGIDQETLNRIAFKDEENTFTKAQTVHASASTTYEVGSTLDKHQDDIQDNKSKLARIEDTAEHGVIVRTNVRAKSFEIDETDTDGGITNVKTSLSALETKTRDIIYSSELGHIFNLLTTFKNGIKLDNSTDITFDGETNILSNLKDDVSNLQTKTTNFTIVGNNIEIDTKHLKLGTDVKIKYDDSGNETDIVAELNLLKANERSDADLITFIDGNFNIKSDEEFNTLISNHNDVRTATQLSNFIKNDEEFKLVEDRVNTLEDTFDKVSLNEENDTLTFNNNIQVASTKKIFAEYTDNTQQVPTTENLDIAQTTGETKKKCLGFNRDPTTQKLTINDDIEVVISPFGVYKNSVTGFATLFPDVGGRTQYDDTITIQNQLASLRDSQSLASELAQMFNYRRNGSFDSNGDFSHEYVFGVPQNGFGAGAFRTRTRNTMRLLGEEIYLGREAGSFYEITDEPSPENEEIPLRATLNNLTNFRDNINSTIDDRLPSLTTTVDNQTISSLIHNNLVFTGLINNYSITGEFIGQWVTPSIRRTRTLGFFTGHYHPSNPTWGLFVFGINDFGLLKMAGKYFDISDDNLPFKEDDTTSRYSREFLYPTGLDGGDPKFREFIVKSWNSAASIKTGPNPNNNDVVEQLNGNTIPHATFENYAGYGVDNLVSSVLTRGITDEITNVKDNINNIYTKTESDNRFANKQQFDNLSVFVSRNDDAINNSSTGLRTNVSALQGRMLHAETRLATIEMTTNLLSRTTTGITATGNLFMAANKSIFIGYTDTNGNARTINVSQELGRATDNISSIETTISQHVTQSQLDSTNENVSTLTNSVNDNTVALTNVYTKSEVDTVVENTITQSGFRADTTNLGKTLQCDNVNVLRGSEYLPALTADDFRQLLIRNVDAVSGTVQQNTVLIAGPNLVIPKSPNPIVFVDTDGRLGSSSLSESRYDDQVFGADGRGEDGNEADNNAQKFQHGLVPSFVSEVSAGSSGGTVRVGSSTHLLTASGTWRQLSDIFVENGVSTVSVSENLPDFQPITKNNQFALCSQVNGGTIFYADVDTSFVPEHASRLYHTPERVNALINTKVSDGSITNAVISHIESQTLTAVSDKRLKTNIKHLDKNIENLDPVEFEYKNDIGKKRYGLIAQDVKKNYPELVETDIDGKLSIKYLDIIGLLIKDNQDLRNKINKIEKFLKIK